MRGRFHNQKGKATSCFLLSASSWRRRRLLRQGHWWWRGKRRSGLLIFNDWPRSLLRIEWFGLGVGFPGCSFSFYFFSTLAFSHIACCWQSLQQPRLEDLLCTVWVVSVWCLPQRPLASLVLLRGLLRHSWSESTSGDEGCCCCCFGSYLITTSAVDANRRKEAWRILQKNFPSLQSICGIGRGIFRHFLSLTPVLSAAIAAAAAALARVLHSTRRRPCCYCTREGAESSSTGWWLLPASLLAENFSFRKDWRSSSRHHWHQHRCC